MSGSEFALIAMIEEAVAATRPAWLIRGIGDDAAVVSCTGNLAIAIDTLVEGRHFRADDAATDVGFKALAVNLSDLAAMAATPSWATLALTLPDPDQAWLQDFLSGFRALADRHDCYLIGGDITRGPRAVTVMVGGAVAGAGAGRDGAAPGDCVYVTGPLGDAALALALGLGDQEENQHARVLRTKLTRPEPRIDLVKTVRERAHAAIDLSDGLAQDLGHILDASEVGATIDQSRIPLSEAFRALGEAEHELLPITGGDDYELCVIASEEAGWDALGASRIGVIEASPGLRIRRANQQLLELERGGYDQFAS